VRAAVASLAGLALALAPGIAGAQLLGGDFTLPGIGVKKRADGILTLMGFALIPDVTTSSLSIRQSETDNPKLGMTGLGGGFTYDPKGTPLFLEGTISGSRYDPKFVASNGTESRSLPVKWNSVAGSGGVGWDFPVAPDWVVRPIFNFALGHMESDVSLGSRFINQKFDKEIEFLQNGRLNSYGYGGSLMLDWERVRPDHEIDLELRYTNIRMKTFDTSEGVEGNSTAQSFNAWARWRAPTGFTALDRPVRYVLEAAHTVFYGDMRGALGFNKLTTAGAGLELDTSRNKPLWVTRVRLVYRHLTGENVSGNSVGLAASF